MAIVSMLPIGLFSHDKFIFFPDGWKRFAINFTIPVEGSGFIDIGGTTSYPDAPNYTGYGVNSVSLFGPQLEVGTFATSYIPTPTALVTRAADIYNEIDMDPKLTGPISFLHGNNSNRGRMSVWSDEFGCSPPVEICDYVDEVIRQAEE